MFRKILLATDGSDSALRAAQMAGELAQKFDAEVLMVYVMLPIPVLDKVAADEGDDLVWAGTLAAFHGFTQAGQDILARTARVLDEVGIRYAARLERGHPAERICEIAEAEQCDLVVIGGQGVNRAEALSLGGVSERVSKCAACSVMIGRGDVKR